jgi:hypothetical protein
MIREEVKRIDWEEPMNLVSPFISSQGGVVFVSGYLTSACNSFAKLVRHSIKDHNEGNICVQLNYDDENTHNPYGIIAKLEQVLEVENAKPQNTNVLAGNTVGRDMVNTNVTINNTPSPVEISRENFTRIKRIVQAIAIKLITSRVVIIILHYEKMPSSTISWFWEQLWANGLDDLASKGFLVICAHEKDDGSYSLNDTMPTPDCFVPLPASYESQDRPQAIADMAGYFVREAGCEDRTATVVAKTLLDEWSYHPSKVHARLPLRLLTVLKD